MKTKPILNHSVQMVRSNRIALDINYKIWIILVWTCLSTQQHHTVRDMQSDVSFFHKLESMFTALR